MKEYRNHNGNSSVTHYQIGEDFINVRFKGGAFYVYTLESIGSQEVFEIMQLIAKTGAGLCRFIRAFVYKKYAHKYIENVS